VDFIEKYLGISPDGGDGSLEVMLLVVCAAADKDCDLFVCQNFMRDQKNRGGAVARLVLGED
jgi:hypothetical protein